MELDTLVQQFASLSRDEKLQALGRLAFELTILGRECYEPGTENLTSPSRLRRLNEVQHRLTSYLLAVLHNDPRRYPDDVFVHIILEHAADNVLQQQLRQLFAQLLARATTAA